MHKYAVLWGFSDLRMQKSPRTFLTRILGDVIICCVVSGSKQTRKRDTQSTGPNRGLRQVVRHSPPWDGGTTELLNKQISVNKCKYVKTISGINYSLRVISSTLAYECKVDSLNALCLDTESGDERRDGWRRPFASSPQSELQTVVREEGDRARSTSKQCLWDALSTGVWTNASLQFDTKW